MNDDGGCYELRGVTKRYDQSFALTVDELNISKHEVLCFLGPTGAGKSTLLRLLAGIDTTASGQIRFADFQFNGVALPLIVQRKITMVFQRPVLLNKTVRANVEHGLKLRGGKKQQMKIDAILDRMELSQLADQPARTLSGGQVQLVALARALVIEPEVLLLDEPTSHLDPAHVALVEQVIADDQKQRGTTVVWATHNLFQTRRVADRVALLFNGEVIEVAEVKAFFESPKDPRTTDFVQGKMIY